MGGDRVKLNNMKHTITLKGIRYSKLSDRGQQIRKYKLRHKVESTVKAISFLAAIGITTLQTQFTA